VVVDDLDVVRVTLRPAQADPPLVVDPDAVLARAVPAQGLEAVARRRLEVADRSGKRTCGNLRWATRTTSAGTPFV
jgi:hypothetical protein